ncbi:hypothetical protein IEE86_16850 [Bacillus sp. 28A-2]|uniref:hypothetical protein n=1 Tax=Bacillus sp. 28A-2 TaxID=2772252 RepID=UPI00168D309E|nr:hypothetical protein [Bacillus sp. 28A-2]MBD3861396.1 hypothetical protein [Bacillus sp. 28A-2]
MDKALAYIDKLAAKLGVAAEHVYGILVNQSYVFGIINIIVGAILLAGFSVLLRLNYLLIAKGGSPSWGEEANIHYKLREVGDGMLFIVIIIVTILAVIFGLVALFSGVMQTINPEYYAIKEILDTIGGE